MITTPSFFLMIHKNNKVEINMREYVSIEEAKKGYWVPGFNARVESYKDYGDEGRKIYSIYGKGGFSSLAFRKGRFYVSISCEDEETAKRFAKYASDAITQ